jgi:hypothetical protein
VPYTVDRRWSNMFCIVSDFIGSGHCVSELMDR